MHKPPRTRILLSLLACMALAVPLEASVLTFKQIPASADGTPIDPAYGQRISDREDGLFRYRGSLGFTPHLTVTYGPQGADPAVWGDGYGDLEGVLYKSNDAAVLLEVTLTADPGWTVVLHDFDLAGYAADLLSDPMSFGSVEVLDGAGGQLFVDSSASVSGTTRNTYSFNPPLVGESLTIKLDLSSLHGFPALSRGGDVTKAIGIDNVRFSERGAASYHASEAIGAAYGPARLALGDLDGDLDDDIVAASYGTSGAQGQLTWAQNSGDLSSFGSQKLIQAGGEATGAAVADMDGDGDLDVVASWASPGELAWYENLGGDFGSPAVNERIIASVADAWSVFVADMDGDGDLDVLSTSRIGGSVQWHENDGTPADGGWIEHTVTSLASGARYATAADLDRDGDLDILAASDSGPVFSWYENLGGGDFGSPLANLRSLPTYAVGGRWIAARDVDGDGMRDIIVASCDDDTIAWHKNLLDTPTADFGPTRIVSSVADCPESISVVDLDNDTDADIIASTRDGFARWYRNTDGAGSFSGDIYLPVSVSGGSDALGADLDLDVDIDIVAATPGKVEVIENGTMHRSAVFTRHDYITTSYATGVKLADLDGDGIDDIVASERTAAGATTFQLTIRLNDGSMTFPLSGSVGGIISDLQDYAAADLDGDLAPDVILVAENVLWYRNQSGTFPGGPLSIATAGASRVFKSALAVDLDRDGDTDVLVTGHTGGGALLNWYENDGTPADGGWVEHVLSVPYERTIKAVAGDLDQDGTLDLAVTAGNDFTTGACLDCFIVWLRGDASQQPPAYTVQSSTPTGQGADAIGLVDARRPLSSAMAGYCPPVPGVSGDARQGDSDPDLLVGTDYTALFHENRLTEPTGDFGPGAGRFTCSADAPTSLVRDLAIDDFNGDALSDFAFTYWDPSWEFGFVWVDGLNVKVKVPGYSFGLHVNESTGVAATDADSDGDLDLLTSDEAGTWGISPPGGPGLALAVNNGGQYLLSRGVGSSLAVEEERVDLLRFTVQPRARSGDSSARLEAFDVRFTDSLGTPLTSAQANNLLDAVHVYRRANLSGSGQFDPAADILVGSIDELDLDAEGIQDVAIPPGAPGLLVAANATFFLVADVSSTAASQMTTEISTTYLAGSFVLKDAVSGALLLEETPAVDLTSSIAFSPRVDSLEDAADSQPGDLVCSSGSGACTLRAAIQEANAAPGPDRILLGPGIYTLGIPGSGEDQSATGDLDIVGNDLTITGEGPATTIIDAAGLDRVFDVHGAVLTLENLTIRNGDVSGFQGDEGLGGGIRALSGEIHISRCVIRDNTAYRGGAIGSFYWLDIEDSILSDNAALEKGGAIYSDGVTTLTASTVSGNVAADHGGISVSTNGGFDLYLSTVSGNEAIPSPFGSGDVGGIAILSGGGSRIEGSTITGNIAATTGGYFKCDACGPLTYIGSSIIAGNQAASGSQDCKGSLGNIAGLLVQDPNGCTISELGSYTVLTGVDPLLGPLQYNGGPTPTHALDPSSPAIDAVPCTYFDVDQRGTPRIDLPGVPNVTAASICDLGAYEVGLVDTLAPVEVPIRWCAVEGSPSFDFSSPSVQEEVNAILQDRHEQVTTEIYDPESRIRFRSAANDLARNYPILPDPDTSVGNPGDVVLDPETRNYDEFLQLIADCRVAWEAQDPSIVGITAVNINRFVDPNGAPTDFLGIGGRASFGNAVQQLDAGRVMVVDRVYRRAPYSNPEDLVERVLGHELGHAAGSLQHGDGLDNPGPFAECANGIIDDNDDKCQGLPRLDGDNLMQYRVGTDLTAGQVVVAREHILRTIPDSQGIVTGSSTADSAEIDHELLNVLDFEYLNVLDFELLNVLDFEYLNVLDFEEAEILDFEYLNVLDFGMDFTVSDPATGDGVTTVYATVAGLPWPTPIRPATTYLWYLDIDEDPDVPGSGDITGARPADYGFPAGQASDLGVDVIVTLELYATCDPTTLVCQDFVVETVFAFDASAGRYVTALGPVDASAALQPVTVGLVQSDPDAEREEPYLSVVLAPTLPNSILIGAVASYQPGDPVAMEVVTAIPCGQTLPNGTVVDCQCTDCALCQDYPGCEEPGGIPDQQKVCPDGTTDCSGEKTCNTGGDVCSSNSQCAPDDFCGGASLKVADSPAAPITFEAPILPGCSVDPPVATSGFLTVLATDFPVDTGRSMTVFVRGDLVHVETTPVFDPVTGEASLAVTLPADPLPGEAQVAVELEGFATTAACTVILAIEGAPPELEPISAPLEPQATSDDVQVSSTFLDEPGDLHTATWSWGDGTVSDGTVTEPADGSPGQVTGTHAYYMPGVYSVSLSLSDSTGNVSTQQFQFVVVYDPDGGFVTGGGFIDSPPGAYAPEPALVGRAHFGFVSRYTQGQSVPTGSTEFEFKVGGLRFKSTSYDWLIVAGARAQFKGTGTINGEGDYGFLVTAVDARESDSKDVDEFRIKIWDRNNGEEIFYDNKMGDADYVESATPLAGGSIVIHKN